MPNKLYNPADPASIFAHSHRLLQRTLAEVVPQVMPGVALEQLDRDGKGGLGQLVEKYFFGYEPNSDERADFAEAGLELKVTPLKKMQKGDLTVKERLVCDMIDYFGIANEEFEESRFFRKSALMLILFYLHVSGAARKDLEFLYSVLWRLKDKDLLIIKQDFKIIRDKVLAGKAHELSEGDTMYLGACRKGFKGQPLREQPFSSVKAAARAFSLKPAYMRTVLEFVRASGKDYATNTEITPAGTQLVSAEELRKATFEEILTQRLMAFRGFDYRQIGERFGVSIKAEEKSRYAHAVKCILHKGLRNFDDAEEFRKSGITVKTIRLKANGTVREHISFENINYNEVYETEEWTDSRWYEIVTSRFMFVIFREDPSGGWEDEARYVLDKVFFWTMPAEDLPVARVFWENIRHNVLSDTLQDAKPGVPLSQTNTFWKRTHRNFFHVRPKAATSREKYLSPVSGVEVPKKCYWFNSEYVLKEIRKAYGEEWDNLFAV